MSTPTNETPKTPIPIEQALDRYDAGDAQLVGLPSPGSLNLLNVFCKSLQGSPLLPKSFAQAQNPGAALLSVILTGREMQMTPMQSLRAFWLSPDGRLGMYGAAMMGAMRRAGVTFEWIKDDDEGCEVKATRRDDGDSYTSTFTPADAKRASLTGQHGRYPRRMCKWRCVSDIWNTLCPDLGGGPIYTTEELHEDEPEPGDKSNEAFRAQAEANRQTEPEKSPFRMTRESAADPLSESTAQNSPSKSATMNDVLDYAKEKQISKELAIEEFRLSGYAVN